MNSVWKKEYVKSKIGKYITSLNNVTKNASKSISFTYIKGDKKNSPLTFCFITFDTFLRSNIKYQMLKVIHRNVNGLFFLTPSNLIAN